MKCPNSECNYDFFEKEEHYICCPKCGAIIPENLEQKSGCEKAEAYDRIEYFKEYLEKDEKIASYMVILWGVFEIGSTLLTSFYQGGGRYFHTSTGKARLSITLFILAAFVSDIYQYQTYKKFFGERVWACSEIRFKIVKGVILLAFAIFVGTKIIPNYYNYFEEYFEASLQIEGVRKLLTFSFHLELWYVCLVVFVSDINDIYHRRLCEEINEW